MNGNRLGELLMDADVITKRQLAKAIQRQVAGDTRRIGEILVEMGYVTVEDLTDIMLNNGHADKVSEVVSEPVTCQTKPLKKMVCASSLLKLQTLKGGETFVYLCLMERMHLPICPFIFCFMEFMGVPGFGP